MALRRVFVFGEGFYRRDAEGAEKGEKINTENTEKSGEHRERGALPSSSILMLCRG
jgi:hypothetical protein